MRFVYPICCNMPMNVISNAFTTCKEPIISFQCPNCLMRINKEQSKCYVKDKVLMTRKVRKIKQITPIETPELTDNVDEQNIY